MCCIGSKVATRLGALSHRVLVKRASPHYSATARGIHNSSVQRLVLWVSSELLSALAPRPGVPLELASSIAQAPSQSGSFNSFTPQSQSQGQLSPVPFSQQVGTQPLDERMLWTYQLQLASTVRVAQGRALAVRCLDQRRVLVTGFGCSVAGRPPPPHLLYNRHPPSLLAAAETGESRDERNCLAVSYKEIKTCIESAYRDLSKKRMVGLGS
ncbi:hypothetical protein BDV93DRAFT_508498 [Ceratobasidium sp. AG-I]|nr:hypothetical protein BDV93DRAFT_508498 [Ceratobasidium sp. AG-I]